jgi:hypothetical protein
MSTLMTAGVEQRLTLRFANGARVYLYHLADGSRIATYRKADGSTRRLDSFSIREDGLMMVPRWAAWVACAWSYEFPVEIEGSHCYTLEPIGEVEVELESEPSTAFERACRLINGDSGARVGLAVSEPLDARIMQSATYGLYQH